MSGRALLLLCAVFGVVGADPGYAAQTQAQRARERAFSALPNWSGLWETEAAAELLATGKFQPSKLWGRPPYNAEWEKKSPPAGPPGERAGPPADLPPAVKACEPLGFPGNMDTPVPDYLIEFLVTPEQTLIVATYFGATRHIYTDGRQHPNAADLWPTEEGDSIGHWEGDTLVIDTIARKAGPMGPAPGAANLSEQAHFTERLRLLDADTLQNDMTIDDPLRFSHPWQLSFRYQRPKDFDRMVAVNCHENDRNPLVDGKFVITPPPAVPLEITPHYETLLGPRQPAPLERDLVSKLRSPFTYRHSYEALSFIEGSVP